MPPSSLAVASSPLLWQPAISPAATTTGGWSLSLLPPSAESLAHATSARDTRHTKHTKRIVFVRTGRTSLCLTLGCSIGSEPERGKRITRTSENSHKGKFREFSYYAVR